MLLSDIKYLQSLEKKRGLTKLKIWENVKTIKIDVNTGEIINENYKCNKTDYSYKIEYYDGELFVYDDEGLLMQINDSELNNTINILGDLVSKLKAWGGVAYLER